ncbi:alpha/beta fold hydrolase [Longimicrobium sp.]|jgi:pimeloyl-ACP methyl ester carboxylesterase|uniref:alpha/beta fold hydrolase n=1 Tax=Longimicrobium sp. TaxID=2029185 RepID=UPI002F951792
MRQGLMGSLLLLAAACAAPGGARVGGVSPAVVDTGRVAVQGGELFYEARGQGPPVVLLHAGARYDHTMWDGQVQALARRHRVIRYDLRGFGRSSRPSGPFSPPADLLRVLEALGVERASLVGLGMGSGVAINFALQHPERVDRLVLASLGAPPPNVPRPPGSPDLASPQGREQLRTLRMPILLIAGGADAAPGLRHETIVEQEVPGVRRVVVPGVGELVNLERPDDFNRLILDFLAGGRR